MRRSSRFGCVVLAGLIGSVSLLAQSSSGATPQGAARPPAAPQASAQQPPLRPPTRADILRGEYGRYRANNDLLFYHLNVRVDPEKKTISGSNTIRFQMLKDDNRIQLDLYANLNVDGIRFGKTNLEVLARAEYRLRRLPGIAQGREGVRDRVPVLRHADGDREIRRIQFQQGLSRQAMDRYRL